MGASPSGRVSLHESMQSATSLTNPNWQNDGPFGHLVPIRISQDGTYSTQKIVPYTMRNSDGSTELRIVGGVFNENENEENSVSARANRRRAGQIHTGSCSDVSLAFRACLY